MPRPTVLPWDKIRDRYVMSPERPSFESLAEEFSCRRETVNKRASLEGWDAQRAQYRHQVAQKTQAKTSTYEAEHRANQIKLAASMRAIAVGQLAKLRMPRVATEPGPDGQPVQVNLPPEIDLQMDVREVRQWLKTSAEIERVALGGAEELDVRIKGELQAVLQRLREALTDDEYRKVLHAIAFSESGEE